jgi:hypothetical protein
MKRVLALITLGASLLLAASPVMAAEVWHWSGGGTGAEAYWTNMDWEAETFPPGSYYETYVAVSTEASPAADTMGGGLCVYHYGFTILENGDWIEEPWGEACGDPSTLTFERRFNGAHVAGTLPFTTCTAWDEQDECIETFEGTFEIDLTFTGYGPTIRSHDSSNGGTAGVWQYSWHGSSQSRSATVSGTVTLDGSDITAGATDSWADLWKSRDHSVEIQVCRPTTGC